MSNFFQKKIPFQISFETKFIDEQLRFILTPLDLHYFDYADLQEVGLKNSNRVPNDIIQNHAM